MNAQLPPIKNEFTPSDTYARHQRQRFWQIIAPVGAGILLILVILALVIRTAVNTGPGGAVSQWADTSVIWLSLPLLLFAVVLALILFMLVYLFARLLKILPDYTLTAQFYARLLRDTIISWADRLVEPILTVRGIQASLAAFFDVLLGRRRA